MKAKPRVSALRGDETENRARQPRNPGNVSSSWKRPFIAPLVPVARWGGRYAYGQSD